MSEKASYDEAIELAREMVAAGEVLPGISVLDLSKGKHLCVSFFAYIPIEEGRDCKDLGGAK